MLMLPFMDPKWYETQMRRRAESALREPRDWNTTPVPRMDRTGRDIGLIASTYRPYDPLEPLLQAPLNSADQLRESSVVGVIDPTGTWRYKRCIFPKGNGLPYGSSPDLWHDAGRVYFDDDVVLSSLDRRRNAPDVRGEWKTLMGLAPAELWSQRSGIRYATGRVVLGGLGMGWLLSQIVEKPSVQSVVVVEKNKPLLDWVGYKLCATMPKVEEVIHGDIWEEASRFCFDKIKFVLDIWDGFGDAQWDRDLVSLRRRGAKCWAWGSARGGK